MIYIRESSTVVFTYSLIVTAAVCRHVFGLGWWVGFCFSLLWLLGSCSLHFVHCRLCCCCCCCAGAHSSLDARSVYFPALLSGWHLVEEEESIYFFHSNAHGWCCWDLCWNLCLNHWSESSCLMEATGIKGWRTFVYRIKWCRRCLLGVHSNRIYLCCIYLRGSKLNMVSLLLCCFHDPMLLLVDLFIAELHGLI